MNDGMTISFRGIAQGAEQGLPDMVQRAPSALRMAADEIDRLTRERDEWRSKWLAMAQAGMIAGVFGSSDRGQI